jgi:hypothetical protein
MKVVCIIEYPGLTYHKTYDQVDYDSKEYFGKSFIFIMDNNNVQQSFPRDFFITLEEWREKQLNELGI